MLALQTAMLTQHDLEQAQAIIQQTPIVILMKGTPSSPKCGFSRRMVSLLIDNGINYSHFNVMDVKDQPLYSAFKQISRFPTFPQASIRQDF
jgi:glutaredoxin-related protein